MSVYVDPRVREFRAIHPKATWADVFACVANHYNNARSMAGAMRITGIKVSRREKEATHA